MRTALNVIDPVITPVLPGAIRVGVLVVCVITSVATAAYGTYPAVRQD